jgi:adenylylsulfate kinase
METKTQSILKAITWRILATIVTGIVVYLYTGELKDTTVITLTLALVSTIAYYFHERLWARIIK